MDEELGVSAEESDLIYLFDHIDPYEDKRTGHIDREISQVFLLKVFSSTEFTLQEEEVDAVRWIHYKDLLEDYYNNLDQYVPHESHFGKLISAIDKILEVN